MSFLSTLLLLYLHISNGEHSFVQCAFLGKRLGWKAEYMWTKNVTASAWITSPPQYPSSTQTSLASAYTTSPLIPLDPISQEEEEQIVHSNANVASADATTAFTDGTLLVVLSEPYSWSPIGEPHPMITLPPTVFESLPAQHSSNAHKCVPHHCEIVYNVSYRQHAQINV